MKLGLRMTTQKKDHDPDIRVIPLNAPTKSRLKKILYFSFPYGNWFPQELMRKGRVTVTFVGDEMLINQTVDHFDLVITYELVTAAEPAPTTEPTQIKEENGQAQDAESAQAEG